MSRMRSSQLSYAPREVPDSSRTVPPAQSRGTRSTTPTLRSRIIAVRHGFEDHVLAGDHVLAARDQVAHGRAVRTLAHRQDVLGYELVQSLRIRAALALVCRKR